MYCYRLYEALPLRSSLGYGPGGGRWNHSGTPLIYTCNCISLTFLELYSIKGSIVAEANWILATFEIQDNLPMLDMDSVPRNWNNRPASHSTKNFGTTWANSRQSLCLMIPSARIPLIAYPKEYNILVNPLHPDFSNNFRLISEEEVSFAIN